MPSEKWRPGENLRSKKLRSNQIESKPTCKWLFTSSLVSPSTFISSLICFGVATAARETLIRSKELNCAVLVCFMSFSHPKERGYVPIFQSFDFCQNQVSFFPSVIYFRSLFLSLSIHIRKSRPRRSNNFLFLTTKMKFLLRYLKRLN